MLFIGPEPFSQPFPDGEGSNGDVLAHFPARGGDRGLRLSAAGHIHGRTLPGRLGCGRFPPERGKPWIQPQSSARAGRDALLWQLL